MKKKLHNLIIALLFLFFTYSVAAQKSYHPEKSDQPEYRINLTGNQTLTSGLFRNGESSIYVYSPDSILLNSVLKKPGTGSAPSSLLHKPELIFNLNVHEGAPSAQGVSKDLRLIPAIGAQLNWKGFGVGIDAGMFSSKPEFNFNSYYSQFDSLGFAVFENTKNKWKSTYISLGPQYTFHLGLPGNPSSRTSAARAYLESEPVAKNLSVTVSLKGGLSINKSPEILIFDSVAPYTKIATYKAPDDYKQNVLNIKPAVSLTYWFNDKFGANVNMQYLIVTGQTEFITAYRDLSKVNFDLDKREIRAQILKSPITESTTTITKGPGNMFNIGAGINYKLGSRGKSKGKVRTTQLGRNDPGKTAETLQSGIAVSPPLEKEQPDKKEKDENRDDKKEYIRPSALSPADGACVASDNLKHDVVLVWTPVTPLPTSAVSYQVKVFLAAEGQLPSVVINSNKPVFDKKIDNISQTAWLPPSNDRQESRKYVWTVRATDNAGKPYGANNGTSEPATFSIGQNDIDIAIDTLKVECCKDGMQLIKLTIKNNLPNTNTILKKIIITAVNGNFGMPYPMDISASVSPSLPFSFLPSSTSLSQGRMNFTASVKCDLNMNTLVVKAEGERNTAMGIVTDNDLESDTLNCICKECDNIKIEIPDKAQTSFSANTVTVNSPVSVTPKKVKKVTAEIVYFSFIPESEDCAPCNKDSKTYGNIISASLNASGFPTNALVPYGHEAVWNSNSNAGALLNGQFAFIVSVPPLVKCCSARIRYCVRYTFQFDDCTVCEKVVCYTINKEGCNK